MYNNRYTKSEKQQLHSCYTLSVIISKQLRTKVQDINF